jgi:hypothetical protein
MNRKHRHSANRLSERNDLLQDARVRAVSSLRGCNHHLTCLRVDGSYSHNASSERKSLDEDDCTDRQWDNHDYNRGFEQGALS